MRATVPSSLAAAILWLLAPAPASAQSLPDGAGRDLVEATCTGCHQPSVIERSMGYSREGWRELILTMIDLEGSEDLETMSAYLATHFPERNDRAPNLVAGDHEIDFTEWVAPTPGQRARDPVEAPDGTIWWVGQWADLAGRLDPATGEMEEFALPGGARPHTVTADAHGNIWYTGNGNATMGKLDPDTGDVTVYPMPDPAATDPHSAIVDADGVVWFTLQRANMIGRLDPASGDIDIVTAPVANSRPYGIKLDPDGVPWVAANGSNRLYRVDPVRWRSPSSNCPARAPRCGVSPSPTTARSGTSTRRWAGWGISTRRPARRANGNLPAAPAPTPMPSRSSTASCGTTSPASAPTPWCASIPRPRRSRAGPSRPATSTPASCATCARPATATC
jgi:streptogramin lyase